MDDYSKSKFSFTLFDSEFDLEDFATSDRNDGADKVCFAFVVNKYDTVYNDFDISIRFDPSMLAD